jgi:hypothetical protein
MNDWTSGYVADIGYTYGYYSTLNPLRARLALLKSGIACPKFETACELGFGQGISVNIHAAATSNKWHGTDFNPTQAAFAQTLASYSGASAALYDEAFLEFCSRSDLPDFDYIGLHGIWSWISDENRQVIVDFIKKKLKVGGLLYISYNTMPGWAAFAPIRKLMTQHSDVIGSQGRGIINSIEGALEFTEELLKTNPKYASANPQIADRVQKLKTQNSHYLAHEYFNRDWAPMHFSEMADHLQPAKLNYACSADYLSHLDALNLTQEQQEFLNKIPDPMLVESVKDFMLNTQFRQDYWVKGGRSLAFFEQQEAILEEKVILTSFKEEIPLTIPCGLGEANLTAAIYNPIIEVLSDYEIHSIKEIYDLTKDLGINLGQILESLMTLAHSGKVMSVAQGVVEDATIESCAKLNDYLMKLSRSNESQTNLASPITGGGIPLSRVEQLFLLGIKQNQLNTAPELADYSWEILKIQGHRMLKDGKAVDSSEENIAELTKRAEEFIQKRLVILKNLNVI